MFGAADLLMATLTITMTALVSVGAARSVRHAGVDVLDARRFSRETSIALVVWLAAVSALSATDFLTWSARPPRWPLMPLLAFVAMAVLLRSAVGRRLRLPLAWPIYAQSFRIGVELALYALHRAGRAPVQVTFEGRNYDILVGLSAPIFGWLIATRRLGAKGALVWNVAGLAVLANTVGTVATSTPGPLHLDWPGAPLTALTYWPIVWLPAFLMPLAVFLHVLSLRDCVRLLRSPAREEPSIAR